MPTNTKENGFETLIVSYLVENNHYEEGINAELEEMDKKTRQPQMQK